MAIHDEASSEVGVLLVNSDLVAARRTVQSIRDTTTQADALRKMGKRVMLQQDPADGLALFQEAAAAARTIKDASRSATILVEIAESANMVAFTVSPL
jgi:hypothetical protein